MHEMQLLIFTIVEQAAVGVFVMAAIYHLLGKLDDNKAAFKIGLVVFLLAAVGACASTTHLGQPLRAINVLFNVGSSWMSREILFFVLMTACALVYAVLAKLDKMGAAKAFAIIGAIMGILAFISTCLCYMQPGVPAWNSALTPLQFLLTVVVVGVPFFMAMFKTFTKDDKAGIWWAVFAVLLISQIAMRWMFFSNIVLLIDTF